MKVRDRLTGSVLYSEDAFVVDGWREKPERFVPVDETIYGKSPPAAPKPVATPDIGANGRIENGRIAAAADGDNPSPPDEQGPEGITASEPKPAPKTSRKKA